MHDTFLFKNIANSLQEIAMQNNIQTFTFIEVDVHEDSHINAESLYLHLKDYISDYIEQTSIKVNRGKAEELTAIIKSVEGKTDDE